MHQQVLAKGVAVVSLVGEECFGPGNWHGHQRIDGAAVRGLAAGEDEAERTSLIVPSGMALSRKTAARSTKSRLMSPPFAPAAETWAQTAVLSIMCCQWSVSQRSTNVCSRASHKLMVDMLAELGKQIAGLDREIARRAKEDAAARRLMTIPGIGPIAATAIIALAPPIETFRKGRDFAAWLGLAPRQHSTGGKQRLGSISKMGERTIRRLLIIGGSSMVRQASRFGAPAGSCLERMLARKLRMLVSVALASKMARLVWALLTRKEDYRTPAAVAA